MCKNRLVTVKCRINFICNQNQLGAPCLYQYIYRTNILSLYGAISLFQALRYNISKKLLGIINRLMKRNYLLLNRDTSLSLRNLLWGWILEMFCDRMFHWHILLSSNLFCAVVWPWTCQWISGSSFYVNECANSVPKFKSLHFTERAGNFLEVSLWVVFLLKIFFTFFRKTKRYF